MMRRHLGWISMTASASTLGVAFVGDLGSPPHLVVLVMVVLAALSAAAVRWGPSRHIAGAAGLAAAGLPLLLWSVTDGMPTAQRTAAAAVWTTPAVVAIVVGGYPRLMAHRRAVAVEQARRAQRLQVARDLHDFVAHEVSGIVTQAQAARFVADSRPEAAGPALARIEAAGLAALASMDQMVGLLHEPDSVPVQPWPTLDDLPGLIDRFRAAGHTDVRLVQDSSVGEAARDSAALAYRIVVEALTNVRRHAATAARVEVSVTGDAAGIEVRVRNDTTGPPPPQRRAGRGGRGLSGLREQVAARGGTLTAGPCEHGWEVVAALPTIEA
ncbi:histidine kinase [Micromonospora sp. WMMD1120]|uniref:sensor histidine kinase n=1 Tax=Micromonospora sp. WMMD1120 TaxID=3016106 RepID=UPI002416C8D8|nr:sensor histidine kinase [Micromonospora sp. WMMD1120]MDG4808841.1 histidine kinase [Micromonospora sp. WMMD1120]